MYEPLELEPTTGGASEERLRTLRLINRLASAFWVWAIVVGIGIAVGGIYVQADREDKKKNDAEHAQMAVEHAAMDREIAELRLYETTTRERQNLVIERLSEMEREMRRQRDEPPRR